MTKLDSVLKSGDITLLMKVHIVNIPVVIHVLLNMRVEPQRRLSIEELMLSNRGAGEDSWEFLRLQGDQPANPKGSQPLIVIGRTDAKAPILWPPDAKSQLIGKDPDAGEDWRQEEKGTTENEMVGWHHQLNGHEFE